MERKKRLKAFGVTCDYIVLKKRRSENDDVPPVSNIRVFGYSLEIFKIFPLILYTHFDHVYHIDSL